MGRIKHITEKELQYLREHLRLKYSERTTGAQLPKFNAYKPNYQDLKDDMVDALEHPNGSISNGRLRKLYFYTDEDKAISGYEEPNFGIDFLDACYLYISDGALDRTGFLRNSEQTSGNFPGRVGSFVGIGVIALLLILSVVWLGTRPNDMVENDNPAVFVEEFDKVDLQSLRTSKWRILDFDNELFDQQTRAGYLSLYTVPGGYYTKPEEVPNAPNTLVRAVPPGATSVVAYFDYFEPYQNWQSVSLVLFDEDLDKQRNYVVGYGYGGDPGHVAYTAYGCCLAGAPAGDYFHVPIKEVEGGPTLRLAFKWDNEKVTAMGRSGKEWDPLDEKGSFTLDFTPAYLGIMAVQGITNDQGNPLGADVIPVYLDKVRIE